MAQNTYWPEDDFKAVRGLSWQNTAGDMMSTVQDLKRQVDESAASLAAMAPSAPSFELPNLDDLWGPSPSSGTATEQPSSQPAQPRSWLEGLPDLESLWPTTKPPVQDARTDATAPAPGVAASRPVAAGGTPSAMPTGAPADDEEDDETYIRRAAAQRGIDPDTAVRVANTEGGAGRGGRARQNMQGAPAFGHFQLYIGGPNSPAMGDEALAAGIDPRDPKQWRRAIDFALDRAKERGWQPFQGAAAAGIGDWDGIGGQPAPAQSSAQQRPQAPSGQPAPMPQGQPEPGSDGLAYTPDQGALDDPDKWALCGPVAAVAMARSRGGAWTVAQAKKYAQENGLWNPSQGMGGLETEAQLLRGMGYAASAGKLDWQRAMQDAATGNPVTLSTTFIDGGHYVVLEKFDPKTGKFLVGGLGNVLKKTSGRSNWYTPQELEALGGIQGALHFDSPASPVPSVAVADPNAAPASPPAAAAPPSPPAAGNNAGAPLASIGVGEPGTQAAYGDTFPPDDPFAADRGPHEALPNTPGSQPPLYPKPQPERHIVGPSDAAGLPQPGNMGVPTRNRPVPGVVDEWPEAQQPVPPPSPDGRNRAVPGWLEPEMGGPGWQDAPPVRGPQTTTLPQTTPDDPNLGLNRQSLVPVVNRQGQVLAYMAPEDEPEPFDNRDADNGPREAIPGSVGAQPLPPPSTYNDPEVGGTVSQPVPYGGPPWNGSSDGSGSPITTPAAAGTAPASAPTAAPTAPVTTPIARPTATGITPPSASDDPGGAVFAAQDSQSRPLPYDNRVADEEAGAREAAPGTPGRQNLVPAFGDAPDPIGSIVRPAVAAVPQASGNALDAYIDAVRQGPGVVDQIVQVVAPHFAPMFRAYSLYQAAQSAFGDTVGRQVGSALGLSDSEMTRLLGVPISEQDVAGFVGQMALDPTNFLPAGQVKPAARAAGQMVQEAADVARPAIREGARAVGRGARAVAEEAAYQTTFGGLAPATARIVPPSVADRLDFPIRVPDDPAVVRAIEAAGGRVDPARGVDLNVIRYQGPEAHGGTATRGAAFYTAAPPGTPSPYARGANSATGVGGTERIEGPTRFRSPLIISDAPGSPHGFAEAMQQMTRVDEQALEAARADLARLNQRASDIDNEMMDAAQRGMPTDALQRQYDEINTAAAAASERIRAIRQGVPTAAEIDFAIQAARRAGPEGSPARAQALKDLVSRYGGDPNLIDDLISIRGADASESAWAIKENIVSANARAKGYDGVVTVMRGTVDEAAVSAHPKVVAAATALEKANAEFDHAVDAYSRGRGSATRIEAARARVEQAEQAYSEANTTARGELGSKITELADVREAANPTPGPTREVDIVSTSQQLDDARKEWRRLAADMRNGRGDPAALDAAMARVSALEKDYDHILRTGSTKIQEQGEFRLREDVKPAAMREAEAAEAARARQAEDAIDARPDVAAAAERANAAAARLADVKARRIAGTATADEFMAAINESTAANGELARLRRAAGPANAIVPFDPASAALGGAAGAASEDEEGGQGDPWRTGGGMLAAGILGKKFPRAGKALSTAQQRAANMAARGIKTPSAWDWLKQAGYSGIYGPATAASSVIGGATELALSQPKEFVRALVQGRPGAYGAQVRAQMRATPDSLTGLLRVLGGESSAATAARSGGSQGTANLSERVVNDVGHLAARALERPGEILTEAPDAVFRPLFQAQGMQREAYNIATAEGLRGQARDQRAAQLMQQVEQHRAGTGTFSQDVADIIEAGDKLADQLGYKGRAGGFAQWLGKASQRDDAVGVLASFLAPFPSMASRVTEAALKSTPGVGLLPGVRRMQPTKFDVVYDQALGTAVASGIAYWAFNGGITGSGPSDPEKRKEMMDLGWQPNSTLVGGYYIPNRLFQRFGPMLDTAGEIHDAVAYAKKDYKTTDLVNDLVKRSSKIATDQVGLSGLADLHDMLSQGFSSQFPGFTARAIIRYLPYGGVMRAGAASMDDRSRRADRWGEDTPLTSAIGQNLATAVPGLRQTVPAAQDTLGRDVPNPQQGLGAIIPRVTTQRQDPTIKLFLDAGVDIGKARDALTVGKTSGVHIRPEESRRWNALRGQFVQEYASAFLESPEFMGLTPEQKEPHLKKFLDQAGKYADQMLQSEMDLDDLVERTIKQAEKKAS